MITPRLILSGCAIVLTSGFAACAPAAPVAEAPAPSTPTPPTSPVQSAREQPPEPLPSRPLEFPAFREVTLDNGLRMILVQQDELPLVNVDLYIESGAANDPAEVAGLAGTVADLLTKGTPTRTAEEISRTIEGVGGSLSAGASQDYLQVGASVMAEQTELAFELVSDVTLHPTFPEDELELSRTRTLTGLQAELAEPSAVASRRFMREIYGEQHPYHLAPAPATIRAIDRNALVDFHRQHFRADNALLVVSGDIEAGEVEALAREYFGAWEGGAAPEPAFVAPPALDRMQIFLVHRPGSVQSSIRIGHVAIRPDNPDYYPLQVLNKVVGAGTDSRLFLILREQKGWTYGAYSQLTRPEDIGYFAATAEVRNEVTDSAVVEMLTQLRRLREEPVPQRELDAAKSFLTGSFPLRIETPGAVARQVAQVRLLGLPIEALTDYRDRIQAVTAADVQRVAREYVFPDRSAIVVVGDAAQIMEGLQAIGPVSLSDVEGNPMEPADLQVSSSGATFDATKLEPGTLRYRVLVQGNPFGTSTSTLAREGDVWVGTSTMQAGPLQQSSEVRFRQDFTPVSLQASATQAGVSLASGLTFDNGRVTGSVKLPPQMGGDRTIDTEVPAGTLLTGMDAFALASAEMAEGTTIEVPIFSEQAGSVVQASFRVTGVESITVPAGTFEAYRVEMTAGPQGGTLWLRRQAPHVTLKQEVTGQPVVIELEEM